MVAAANTLVTITSGMCDAAYRQAKNCRTFLILQTCHDNEHTYHHIPSSLLFAAWKLIFIRNFVVDIYVGLLVTDTQENSGVINPVVNENFWGCEFFDL